MVDRVTSPPTLKGGDDVSIDCYVVEFRRPNGASVYQGFFTESAMEKWVSANPEPTGVTYKLWREVDLLGRVPEKDNFYVMVLDPVSKIAYASWSRDESATY